MIYIVHLKYDFFVRISQAFPLLNKLRIVNVNEQDEHQEISLIIEFSHLTILDIASCNMDYVKQFLLDSKTRLPCLNTLHIKDIHLFSFVVNEISSLSNCNILFIYQ